MKLQIESDNTWMLNLAVPKLVNRINVNAIDQGSVDIKHLENAERYL